MESILFLWGGLLLGCLHALDADHICTVSTLMLKKQSFKKTFSLAFRWSLGHSLTLLILAVVVFGMKASMVTASLDSVGWLVGASMILLGGWVLWQIWQTPAHAHAGGEHSHSHSHSHSGGVLFGMGALHGTAGSSSFFVLIPISITQSFSLAMGYVFFFSVGMILTMGLYSFMVNKISWIASSSANLTKLKFVSALATMFIGVQLIEG